MPASEIASPVEKILTPGCKSIEELANFLNVGQARTAKAVFLVATIPENGQLKERFVFAVIRGDMEVNETKLANVAKADWLRPATEDEIRDVGATPGYASPIGLKNARMRVIVDDAVPSSPNLVAGANEAGYHLLNTNLGRDYEATIIADITAAGDGDACLNCGQPLYTSRGVEVGNIFKLGTRYSAAINATFLATDGTQKPIVMGSYGIGSGRLLACIAEEHHDDKGLIWPITVAPYHVHLVSLGQAEAADRVYETLLKAVQETPRPQPRVRVGDRVRREPAIAISLSGDRVAPRGHQRNDLP
ncbi:MAG: hypothetical protein HGB26_07095 [Desulfobulbaceae bacterium]|nr:hypothetical protein [Desulfobulbaceae bacterium]